MTKPTLRLIAIAALAMLLEGCATSPTASGWYDGALRRGDGTEVPAPVYNQEADR